MSELKEATSEFRDELIAKIGVISIFLHQPSASSRAILYTKGMSQTNQHELAGKTEQVHPFIELYFLLPPHWSFAKSDQQWPLSTLQRMIVAQTNQSAWFGPGDTLTAHPKSSGEDSGVETNQQSRAKSINEIFKQNYFFLIEPIAAQPILSAIGDNSFHWLGIVPIFQKEFDYKNSRSALELLMKFEKKNMSELIDEHRPLAAKRKFFGLF